MKVILTSLFLLCSAALSAQTFDKSATGSVRGNYYVRQVMLSDIDANTGAIGRSRSLLGTATLDGAGNYTLTGSLMDTQTGSARSYSVSGSMAIAANGLFQMTDPLDANSIVDGGVGFDAFVGSATEANFQDLLVMIPAGTTAPNNASLSGSYRMGAIEFLQGNAGLARGAYFTLSSSGTGTLNALAVTGSAVNLGNAAISQTVTGATYSFAQGQGTVNFPLGSGSATGQLISGTKTLYISADGNLLLGGSPGGFDILLGIRALPVGAAPALSGTYFVAGLDEDASTASSPVIDAFSGSVNGTPSGIGLFHERVHFSNQEAFDQTFADAPTFDAGGAANQTLIHYDVGVNGNAFLMVGRTTQYTIGLGLHADTFVTPGSVFLNPLGIVNAANFAPITNSVAPNEAVTLFGSGLAPTAASADVLPLPKSLAGVQVIVNGRPAPLFFVSDKQINLLAPSNLPEDYATFQVINGSSSNAVTVYANASAPGVFTQPAGGVSTAAALHADYTLVNDVSPAMPGETILIYLTGLGLVSPAIQDGAAAPSDQFINTVAKTTVFFGTAQGTVSFSGLAPLYAGLYQLNVVVPPDAPGGTQLLHIDTPEAVTEEALIPVSGFGPTAPGGLPAGAPSRHRRPGQLTRSSRGTAGSGARRSADQP